MTDPVVYQLRDAYGNIVSFTPRGAIGVNRNTNGQPALPNVGSAFANAGPYANYVPVATVAANPLRRQIVVENNSTSLIVVILDDGTATGGQAPVSASVFPLSGTAVAGGVGVNGIYKDNLEQGRVQVYAQSLGLQIMVREN